jgi:HEAT repeat protein
MNMEDGTADELVEMISRTTMAVEPLIETLKDDNENTRLNSIKTLGELRDPRAVRPLLQIFRDRVPRNREAAAWALYQIGNASVEPLVEMLDDPNEAIRERTQQALSLIENPRAPASLVTALRNGSAQVRQDAAFALHDVQDASVIDPLIEALEDEEPGVRLKVVETLGELQDPITVEPLIECLEDPNLTPSVLRSLGQIGDATAIPAIMKYLRNEERRYSDLAAEALVNMGQAGIPDLSQAVDDPSEVVRENAVWALGEIGHPSVVPALISGLSDPVLLVREKAAEALGKNRAGSALQPLIRALNDDNLLVRVKAAEALGELGKPAAVEPLIRMLRDENAYVREHAIQALGMIKDARAIEPLIRMLRGEEAELASRALGRITGVVRTRKEWPEWWDKNQEAYMKEHAPDIAEETSAPEKR